MKQTEIGMIPDDWEVTTIGQQTEIFGRIGFRGYTINDIVDEGFGAITLSPSNIQNNKMDYSKCTYLSWAKYEESPEIKIYDGDILIVKTGSTYGKSAIVKNLRKKATINPQFVVLKKIKCSNELLSYLIQNPIIQSQIEEAIVGGAIPTLSQKQIASFKLPLPPTIAEQQKIAKALSDVDNVISTLEKLITKKKNLKQGTMQQLLTGKKRLPGFGQTTATKQTELGEIPADWEIVNINKTCTIKARIGWQGLKSDEYLDTGDYLLITGTDFDNGFINWKNCNYVTEWRFKQDKNIQIKKGDVLITKDGTIGKVAFLNEIPMAGTLNSGVFVVRPKDYDSIDSVFLSLIFKSFWFDNFLEQITSGSTIVHLYQKDFVKFNYILPSKPEQTAIANVLSSMDKEIEALNTKLEKYRDLKTGMMQQLLTGKIRLA